MRLGMVLLLIALALPAPRVAGSHTTSTGIEIDMGEAFDLLRGAGEVVDVAADPPGILEIKRRGKLKVEVQCTRIGKTRVTIRYRAGDEIHTSIIAVTCVQKER